jgi:DnaJ-class molecular chaperone
MSKANKCPVCDGRRMVPCGFYNMSGAVASTAPEICLSCKGTGYVIVPEDKEPETKGPGILNG